MAKSRLTAVNLSSTVLASSSSARNLITSSDPRKLIAAGTLASRTRRNSKPDAASSSQVKVQDAYLGGLMNKAMEKPVATKEESGTVDLSESESWSFHEEEVTEKLVAYKTATGKPAASNRTENSLGKSWS